MPFLNAVLVIVAALCPGVMQAGTQAVTSPLDGVWAAQEMVGRGQAAPSEVVANVRFSFKGDKVTIRGNRGDASEDNCTFTIDPSASPHRIDIVNPNGVTMEGIYEINGGVLRLALGRPRPTDFASPAGSSVTVITFKKSE